MQEQIIDNIIAADLNVMYEKVRGVPHCARRGRCLDSRGNTSLMMGTCISFHFSIIHEKKTFNYIFWFFKKYIFKNRLKECTDYAVG